MAIMIHVAMLSTPLEAAANVARIAMHERGIARGSSMQMMHTVSSGEAGEWAGGADIY